MKQLFLFVTILLSAILMQAQIPTDGLIAYYPFNGNANDESGNGNNGTVVGATLTSDRFGVSNKAYHFGNSLIYCTSSQSLNTLSTTFTISAWINLDTIIRNDVQNIVGKFLTGEGYLFEINYPAACGINAPRICFNSPRLIYLNGNIDLSTNSWHHLVGVYDGISMKIYIDNTINTSIAATDSITSGNADLRIGGNTDISDRNYLYGKIDDIRIYNRALNNSEIQALYHENGWYPCKGVQTVDYGNQTYHTVAIGEQCWLKENLNIGIMIDSTQEQMNDCIIEKYCYNNDSVNCNQYGGLYQWNEALQYAQSGYKIQGICPNEWHIPSLAEFEILSESINGNSNYLKAIGQGIASGAGNDNTGFSALIGGFRAAYRPTNNFFYYLNTIGFFWSSKEADVNNAYALRLDYDDDSVYFSPVYLKGDGYSIRCLCDISNSFLPVELNLFTAKAIKQSVKLNWRTETEANSFAFDIERKLSMQSTWQKISSVKAAGTSNSPHGYSYLDAQLAAGNYQYRLKMIDNDGTFKYSSIVEASVAVPDKYVLGQNYPNPFNPSTTISFSLPERSNVIVSIYNQLGQKITELFKGEKPAGLYSLDWNASNLVSGIYYYELKTGKHRITKKLILMK